MRSRYSAYVLGLGDYLLQTWHPDTRPREPLVFDPAQQWLRLEVREAPPPSGDQGVVTFVAVSKLGGRAHRLHERSRFVRVAGRWLYRDGELR
jgi:SEC-C motif-containing protein